ncbi:MAG: UvrD-helicase domain-containing protein [Patescibacteria group bacterium]
MSVFYLTGDKRGAARKIDYQAELNPEQLDVVLHADGPALVLAGAGSGKTRTVTYRVAYLLEQGIAPEQILLLTFTNKAAREMLQRVTGLLGNEAAGLWGGTFHSVANRVLRMTGERLGFGSRFTILDSEDAQSLLKAVLREMAIDPKARRFPTAAVLQNVISFSRNTLASVGQTLDLKHPNFVPFTDEIGEIAKRYAARKLEANAMDFDDLLTNWLAIFSHPEVGPGLAGRFRYVLVDEYQDTNAIQAALVVALGQKQRNVLVVGDDAQSIYAFRGANVQNILRFPDEWRDAKIFKLLTNYRSVPEILNLANDSLQHNTGQFQKELVAVRGKGERPTLVVASSARQEAQFVAEQILQLRSQGTALGNMAVLFRSSAHSQSLEFELMKRDVPYEYRGGMKFFERAHIKDALAYIRVAANPQDEAAWLRVLNLQPGIGAATATQIIQRLKSAQAFDEILEDGFAAALPPRGSKGWDEFREIALMLKKEFPMPGHMLRQVLDSAYRDYLEREYPDWRERIEDVEQLVLFAENYRDLTAFLADIALYDEVLTGREKADQGETERIVLSTIHQAKGLEWDTVFLIHLADSAFPNKRALGEEGGLEEERRLFYVAVTRARKRLFLTYPLTSGYDALILNQPSLFIDEVSPHLLERMELRETERPTFDIRHSKFDRDSEWSWDEGYEEPAIEIGHDGDRKTPTTTVWKSSAPKDKKPPTSFLRDVGEL